MLSYSNKLYNITTPLTSISCPVEVKYFNSSNYLDESQLLGTYYLLISNYIKYKLSSNKPVDFYDFIKSSTKSENGLSDFLTKTSFEIENESIYIPAEEAVLKDLGQIIIDTYQINLHGSYLFIQDLNNNKKYMYYGD